MVSSPAFALLNPEATGPVVVSVPHGGRTYAPEWRAMLRPPIEKLRVLEDRRIDAVAEALENAPVLVAHMPRVWIDLNRHEAEIDPGLVDGFPSSRAMLTPKVRSGLGLIPRRLAGVGELWRGRLARADVEARIEAVHRPYHTALAGLLRRSLERHGVAILLDLHSMPPLAAQNGRAPDRIVIGNRFGQSAAPWLSARVAATCTRMGHGWRENSPYAGGHTIERHGAPQRGVHAIQLEIDRALYLDPSLDGIDPEGLAVSQRLLSELVADLSAAALDSALPLAAE